MPQLSEILKEKTQQNISGRITAVMPNNRYKVQYKGRIIIMTSTVGKLTPGKKVFVSKAADNRHYITGGENIRSGYIRKEVIIHG